MTVTRTPSSTELESVSESSTVAVINLVDMSICAVERKRRQRMKRLGKLQEHAESYDTLVRWLSVVDYAILHHTRRMCQEPMRATLLIVHVTMYI